jgi:hypothetical protein
MNTQSQTTEWNEGNLPTVGSNWSTLYKAGGAAALLSVLFFPIQIVVFLISPPPDTVAGWFALFQQSQLIGLLNLDLLLMVDQVLLILIFLAFYEALRRTNESIMTIGLVFGIVSVVLFIASNPAYAMLSLSNRYAAAETEAQRTLFLTAGQAMIETWQGSAFQAAYLLGSITPILMSVVMLQSKLFSKATAYFGILANGIALGLYVPVIGIYISVFSVVFLWIWYILIARNLFQLGKGGRGVEK